MTDKSCPQLLIRRLRVTKGVRAAYDEEYHAGVNIIRGANSSGKSTVMDLLFYGLGGDFASWKPEAAACDTVIVEAAINDHIVSLRRDITSKGQQPMWIFLGTIDEGNEQADQWLRYAYARTPERESFSQAIFRLLNVPDVSAEDESNITVHQILRLLYADQITPITRIFRFEQFDSPQKRQAVGDFVLGIFDNRIYLHPLALRQKQREFEKIADDLSNLYRILGQSGESFTADFLLEIENTTRQEIEELETRIAILRQQRSLEISHKSDVDPGVIESLRLDLASLTERIAELKNRIFGIQLSIEDSKDFIIGAKKEFIPDRGWLHDARCLRRVRPCILPGMLCTH